MFKRASKRLGVDDTYLRKAFSVLIDLDIDDYYVTAEGFEFYAYGDMIKIREGAYEVVITDNAINQLTVHEKRPQGKTPIEQWEEVYRSNRVIVNNRFYHYIKLLYGDGTCNKIKAETISSTASLSKMSSEDKSSAMTGLVEGSSQLVTHTDLPLTCLSTN